MRRSRRTRPEVQWEFHPPPPETLPEDLDQPHCAKSHHRNRAAAPSRVIPVIAPLSSDTVIPAPAAAAAAPGSFPVRPCREVITTPRSCGDRRPTCGLPLTCWCSQVEGRVYARGPSETFATTRLGGNSLSVRERPWDSYLGNAARKGNV